MPLVWVLQHYHSKVRDVPRTHTYSTERNLSPGKKQLPQELCLFKVIRNTEFGIIWIPLIVTTAQVILKQITTTPGTTIRQLTFPHHQVLCVFLHKSTTPGNSKSEQIFRLCRKVVLHFLPEKNCLWDKPQGFKTSVLWKSLQVFCMTEKAFFIQRGRGNWKWWQTQYFQKVRSNQDKPRPSSDIVFRFLLNQGKVSLPKQHKLPKIKLQLYLSKLCEVIFTF